MFILSQVFEIYIAKIFKYIAKTVKISYNVNMKTTFIKTQSFGGVTFRYSRGPSLASGKELHPHHEILYYLGGDAEFLSTEYHLLPYPGTLFVIPKEHFHNFRIADEENYIRLTLAFGNSALPFEAGKILSGIRVITPDCDMLRLLDAMCEKMAESAEQHTTAAFMYGAFLMLVSQLDDSGENEYSVPDGGSVAECIRFIDEHFFEALSLSRLCDEMHISESALFRLFKKELGITPHKYIAERRLIEANKLISEGKPASLAATLSGFFDYSSFYKAYVKKFGTPPSHTM